jgi:polyphosphate:AMP phosphotransferase
MFETAELGQTVSKQDYLERVPLLRERLLDAQQRLRTAPFPVLVLFAGVDGAGKSDTTNLLNEWLDPRWITTLAYSTPSEEEVERPEFWRFWRDLPAKGQIGIFLSAWYSEPLLQNAFGKTDLSELDRELEKILAFERTLVDDGALILKFWMHLGKDQQKERLTALEADPTQRWRVTKRDWKHWKMYKKFVRAAEQIIMRTSTGNAPWTIVEGMDDRYRSLKVATHLLEEVERRLGEPLPGANNDAPVADHRSQEGSMRIAERTILSGVELSHSLEKRAYSEEQDQLHARLNPLHRLAYESKVSTILVFEGWDAGGKGGAIRRITRALDARNYQVFAIGPPTDEEQAHHYLWRFWRHLSRAGRFTIYDRSWYGRVLVERVEGFATKTEWRRAYAEINDFERQLADHGTVVLKFWIHISPEEQERRFKDRAETPYKRWKLTEEDWRNREKWAEYESAVDDMIERTSTAVAPWHLISGNDKRYARVEILTRICEALEARLG